MNGWIKLHRKLLDHWLFRENRKKTKLEAWLIILLECNHTGTDVLINGSLIKCGVGQSVKSVGTWSKQFNWSDSRTRSFLKLLKKDGMIELEGLSKTTRLTVCNYDSYQGNLQTDNKQTTNKKQTQVNKQEEVIRIDNEKNINNSDFKNECLNDAQWIEVLAMQKKVDIDVVKLFLTTFENHLITMEEQKSNLKKFKEHFVNWFNKQNLYQFTKKITGKTNQ